jgi:hypothetical protein
MDDPPAVEPEDSLSNLQKALTGLNRAAGVDPASTSMRTTIGHITV